MQPSSTPALLTAIEKNDPDLFEFLIQHGADVHMEILPHERKFKWFKSTSRKAGVLWFVVEQDDVAWLRRLLPYYVPERSRQQVTPLHVACHYNSPQCLNYLLSLPGISGSINAKDANGATPLFTLVSGKDCTVASIKALLEHGAMPNSGDSVSGESPLHTLAVRHSGNGEFIMFIEQAELLLEAGADVLAENRDGHNVLVILIKSLRTIASPSSVAQNIALTSDSVKLNCSNFMHAVQKLVARGGSSMVTHSLPYAVVNYLHIIRSLGFCRYLRRAHRDPGLYFEALPTLLTTIEKVIELFLRHGADTSYRAHNIRMIRDLNCAEAVTSITRAVHRWTSRHLITEGLYQMVTDHFLRVLRMILSSGQHTHIHPKYLDNLLFLDVPRYISFLDAYLDSIPVAAQGSCLSSLLKLLDETDDDQSGLLQLLHETDDDQAWKDALLSRRCRLLSLRYLSRFCILSVIGTSGQHIERLPLPEALKQYVKNVY